MSNCLLISVIIPTYKPGIYIYDCLLSLVKQTLSYDKFEIILVLNGCNRPYYDRLEGYILKKMKGMNVRLLQTDIPGVSNARNLGLDIAQGEFIAFIDDDDYVSPSYLEKLYFKSSSNIVALSYGVAFCDGGVKKKANGIENEYNKKAKLGKQSPNKIRHYFSGPWMKLIHRDIIGHNRFNIQFKNREDSLFMFLISNRIRYVDFASREAIYYRRFRVDSATTRKRTLKDRLVNSFKVIVAYTKIYFQDFPHYSLWFYITRIMATLKSLL